MAGAAPTVKLPQLSTAFANFFVSLREKVTILFAPRQNAPCHIVDFHLANLLQSLSIFLSRDRHAPPNVKHILAGYL
jgi:hypothetical protein